MSSQNLATSYDSLKDKWVDKNRAIQKSLWERHFDALSYAQSKIKHSTVSTIGAFLLLVTPISAAPHPQETNVSQNATLGAIAKNVFIISDLSHVLPSTVSPLSQSQENEVIHVISRDYNVSVQAQMQGIRLNQNYGYIGAEQHLARYPGDSVATHFSSQEDMDTYGASGMAPGLSAWGYFASDEADMTQIDSDREKWYIAVPTFLSPGYNENTAQYNAFFKWRKMLVVNPQNGKAVVSVIGDSGPAPWTGKQLGGSPELMYYLDRVDGSDKGPVLYFFIDDPSNTLPLGPLNEK